MQFRLLLQLFLKLLIIIVAKKGADGASLAVEEEGVIPATDSDFLFLEIKKSILPPHVKSGLGVFAKFDIPVNEVLCEYRGAVVPINAEFEYPDPDYIYASRTYTNDMVYVLPNKDKLICAFINDCVNADPDAYTSSELEAVAAGKAALKTHPGYSHNAGTSYTKMGKILIMSATNISAGSEVYLDYGPGYWLQRIRQQRQLQQVNNVPVG